MNARYDVSGLDPSIVGSLKSALDEQGILHVLAGSVLTISEADEPTVNAIVARLEAEFQARTSISRNSDDGGRACEVCASIPAAMISLRRQVGMVVARSVINADAILCGPCAEVAYKDYQKQTAIKGWTGSISAVTNPFMLGLNASNIRKHRAEIARLTREL